MKKIVFTVVMFFAIAGFGQAQTSATKVNSQKKEITKPAGPVSTVSAAAKKSTNNTKAGTAAPGEKITAANIGKHKKAHRKVKKPVKKS